MTGVAVVKETIADEGLTGFNRASLRLAFEFITQRTERAALQGRAQQHKFTID